MDSDVEMVEPPGSAPPVAASPPHSAASSPSHVSSVRSHSRSRSVLDDLDDYGSPSKGERAADEHDDKHNPDAGADAPPTTNDDGPLDNHPDEEQEQDHDDESDSGSESENSSDNASEDDVDKDLIPEHDNSVEPAGALTAARWDEPTANGDAPAAGGDADVVMVEDGDAERGSAIRIPVLMDSGVPALGTPPPPTSPLSAPPTSAAKPAPTQKKPKSHHAPPPPPPPPPAPPMQTIRLEIRLGGPENYEVDVKGIAVGEGMVWGEITGKRYADDSSEGEDGEDDGEGGGEDGKAKDGKEKEEKKDADGDVEMGVDADGKPKKKSKSKKKSKAAAEYYDTSDPFIDDSELAIDERTYFAQTKQKGFYVSSGEVALVRDKSPKKPKSRKKTGPTLSLNLPTSTASTSALKPPSTATAGPRKAKSLGGTNAKGTKSAPASKALGTKESPIPLEDEDEDNKGDVFGFGGTQGGRRASGKGKEKAEDDDDASSIAEGVNRMKGKWKERVSVNGASSVNGNGPISPMNGEGDVSVKDEDEEGGDGEVGKKRKRGSTVNGAGANESKGGDGSTAGGTKKRKTVDIASFHPELQVSIEKMKEAIAAESWEQKSKFPPNLKPLLASLSLQAVTLDQYDDNFFNLMPTIFPYNKFTMSKLIKRTIFHDHTALLNQRQDDLLEQLQNLATAGFPKAQEEWERSLQNYEEKRKEKALANGDPESVEGSTGPTRHGTEDPEAQNSGRVGSAGLSSAGDGKGDKEEGKDGGGKDGNGKEGPGKGGAHHGPPLKKYRMNEDMKKIVWELVLLSNEICRLENEKNGLEGSVLQVSEQGLRKVLYQRIVSAFPEGWMSSGQISRDVSAMKKKYEKEAAED